MEEIRKVLLEGEINYYLFEISTNHINPVRVLETKDAMFRWLCQYELGKFSSSAGFFFLFCIICTM